MRPALSAETVIAGVAGRPVRHSLSPLIHNAWLEAAGIDGVYVAFSPGVAAFAAFAGGLRGGVIRGLNVTAPFKQDALAIADDLTERARGAGSANLLLFEADGVIRADNTDGDGLLGAFAEQAPDFDSAAAPVVIIGAGGAARGAAHAFLAAGAPEVRIVNRDRARAEALAALFGPRARAFGVAEAEGALGGAGAVINATPVDLGHAAGPAIGLETLGPACVVMDMVYRPVRTAWLDAARDRGLVTVDGLAMLIGQAKPSFEAFFARPPGAIDVRALALAALER